MASNDLSQEEILDLIKEDPACSPHEKEFSINFNKETKEAKVYSGIRGLMTGLVKNGQSKVTRVTYVTEDKLVKQVEFDKISEEIDPETDAIIGVFASVPLGALKIQKNKRKSNTYSTIIST